MPEKEKLREATERMKTIILAAKQVAKEIEQEREKERAQTKSK